MKNIFRFFMAAMIAVTFASCEEQTPVTPDDQDNPPVEKPVLNENLAFTLEVKEVTSESAKIAVKHNGEATDTWYGFYTTETDIDKAVTDKIAEVSASGKVSGLKKDNDMTVTLNRLEAETAYTYVAFGLTSEGVKYGKTASVGFTTTAAAPVVPTEYTECDTWSMTYDGREEYEGAEYDLFTVTCEAGNRYYFTTVETYLLQAYQVTVQQYVESEVANVKELLKAGYTLDQLMSAESATWSIPRLVSGEYICLAIGFNEDGTPTMYYSADDAVIEEEEATAAYNQWLGVYEFVSASGVAYDIEIAHYDNNYMYAVYGWECGSHFDETGMDFGTALGDYVPAFPAYFTDGKIAFSESEITMLNVTDNSGKQVECVLGLYGYVVDGDQLSIFLTEGSTLAVAETDDNGATGTINGATLTDETGNSLTVQAMGYAAVATDYSTYFLWNYPAVFPMSMTKIETAQVSQQSVSLKPKFNNKFAVRNGAQLSVKAIHSKAL